jgi:chitinase domain-containing protein 1
LFKSGETLAYVTPWNSHGYDIAKKFRGKFTMISPVWFQLLRHSDGRYATKGDHDVDAGWLHEVKDTEKPPKIVPRFMLDGWKETDYMAVMSEETVENEASTAASILIQRCKENAFDGVVLEVSFPQYMEAYIRLIGKKLHQNKLITVLMLPVSTSIPPNMQPFTRELFERISEEVDFFSLMTYDYSNANSPGANAPVTWIESEVKRLCSRECSKLLMGLNFYGNNFVMPRGGGPILGKDFVNILDKYEPKIQWDSQAEEHHFLYERDGKTHVVYYPSLLSLDVRMKLAGELGVGLAIWEIGQGLDYFFDLF